MKKIVLISLCYFSAVTSLNAQNLVPNYSFEVQDTCPAVSQIELAQPWNSATIGTPDLFNSTCSTQNSAARTGVGSSGVYTFNTFPNNREYMQAPLNSALIAGQTYCISFYVKRSNFRYACNRIGAYVNNSEIHQTTTSVLAFTPQVDNDPANMLSSSNWVNISGSFTAAGGENNILIGSFANDATTDTVVINAASTSEVCYYKIDDVSVTECTSGLTDLSLDQQIEVFPNPASNQVSIQLNGALTVLSVGIYDAVGKEVMLIDTPQANTGVIELNNIYSPDGTYILRILSTDGIINKKLIIRN